MTNVSNRAPSSLRYPREGLDAYWLLHEFRVLALTAIAPAVRGNALRSQLERATCRAILALGEAADGADRHVQRRLDACRAAVDKSLMLLEQLTLEKRIDLRTFAALRHCGDRLLVWVKKFELLPVARWSEAELTATCLRAAGGDDPSSDQRANLPLVTVLERVRERGQVQEQRSEAAVTTVVPASRQAPVTKRTTNASASKLTRLRKKGSRRRLPTSHARPQRPPTRPHTLPIESPVMLVGPELAIPCEQVPRYEHMGDAARPEVSIHENQPPTELTESAGPRGQLLNQQGPHRERTEPQQAEPTNAPSGSELSSTRGQAPASQETTDHAARSVPPPLGRLAELRSDHQAVTAEAEPPSLERETVSDGPSDEWRQPHTA